MGRNQITLTEAFEKVISEHWGQPRYVKSGRLQDVTSLFKRIEPAFGGRALNAVTGAQVRKWHREQMSEPSAANRALEVLSRIYSYANENEWCENNPCRAIKAFPERKRKRFATPDEIKKIQAMIRGNLDDAVFGPGALFLLAMLYTGARPKSLVDAKWDQLKVMSEGHGVLTFHGKSTADSGEDEVLIFPAQLMCELEKRPKRKDGRLFHPSNWRLLWKNIQKVFGLKDLWVRDLRRTFATVALSNGVSIDAIAEALNHKSSQTTKIYAKLFDETRVKTTNAIALCMQDLI